MIQYTNMYKVIRQVTLKQLMLLQLLPRIRQNLRIHSRLDAYTYIIFFFSMPVRHCLPFTHFPYDFGKNKRRANMLFSLLFHHRLRRRRRCRRSIRTKWYCRCVCLYERHTSFVKPIIIGFIHAYKSTTRVKITLFSSIQVLLIFTSFYSVCSVVMCVCVYLCVYGCLPTLLSTAQKTCIYTRAMVDSSKSQRCCRLWARAAKHRCTHKLTV